MPKRKSKLCESGQSERGKMKLLELIDTEVRWFCAEREEGAKKMNQAAGKANQNQKKRRYKTNQLAKNRKAKGREYSNTKNRRKWSREKEQCRIKTGKTKAKKSQEWKAEMCEKTKKRKIWSLCSPWSFSESNNTGKKRFWSSIRKTDAESLSHRVTCSNQMLNLSSASGFDCLQLCYGFCVWFGYWSCIVFRA